MRTATVVFMLLVFIATPATAQEWAEYVDRESGFKVNFPGTPTLAETTWTGSGIRESSIRSQKFLHFLSSAWRSSLRPPK
jgi:hypothetical protein